MGPAMVDDMTNEKLVIIGCGGLGREVLWAARRAQTQSSPALLGFATDAAYAPEDGALIDGLPFLGPIGPGLLALQPEAPTHFICAVGENGPRQRICEQLEALGLKPHSVIDPSVIIGPEVQVGPGTYVGAGCILSPSAELGRHVVVNHHCSIGHGSRVGAFAQVCPGARISGWAQLGEGVLVGSNGVVAPKVVIGAWSILGAASLASRALPAGVTALGIPAKILFRKPLTPTP